MGTPIKVLALQKEVLVLQTISIVMSAFGQVISLFVLPEIIFGLLMLLFVKEQITTGNLISLFIMPFY